MTYRAYLSHAGGFFIERWSGDPDALVGHRVKGRDTLTWLIGTHSLKLGDVYQKFIWPRREIQLSARVSF